MTRRSATLASLLSLLVLAGLSAQELVTLTVPIARPSTTNYRVERVVADFEAGVLRIFLRGSDNEATRYCAYTAATTPTGATVLTALNKANLSTAYAGNATTGSLKQRIFHRLVVMGEAAAVCDGTMAGSLAGTVP
jgi:hypothetical protein